MASQNFTVPAISTSVLVPSNGATLSGSTYLDASASNATSVEFLLFGGIYGYSAPVICTATPTIYGWLCGWNTTTVPDGSYVLVSEASGAAGSAFSLGRRHHRREPAADHERSRPLERGDAVRIDLPRRLRLERHQRRVPALRRHLRLCRPRDLHGHADHLRMAVRLEHHDGPRRLVRLGV